MNEEFCVFFFLSFFSFFFFFFFRFRHLKYNFVSSYLTNLTSGECIAGNRNSVFLLLYLLLLFCLLLNNFQVGKFCLLLNNFQVGKFCLLLNNFQVGKFQKVFQSEECIVLSWNPLVVAAAAVVGFLFLFFVCSFAQLGECTVGS